MELAVAVVFQVEGFALCAEEEQVDYLLGKGFDRHIKAEVVLFRHGPVIDVGHAVLLVGGPPAADGEGPLQHRQFAAYQHQIRIHPLKAAYAAALGTGAEGAVEGKGAGRKLVDAYAAVGAGVILGKGQLLLAVKHNNGAVAEMEGQLQRVGEALADVGPHHKAVDDYLDAVLLVLFKSYLLGELVKVAVRPHTDVAALFGVLQHLLMLALFSPDDGSQYVKAAALVKGQYLIHYLIHGLLLYLPSALGAVGHAHPGEEQTEVVVYLRHGAHGGAGIFVGGLLVDADGGAETLDVFNVGLFHLAQKHTGVGGEGLHVPPLSLGVNGVEGQRGLAAAADAGEHHQLVPGDFQIDIFKIVLFCALDYELVFLHFNSPFNLLILSRSLAASSKRSSCAASCISLVSLAIT